MSRFVLHIGMHKTGSTSIQASLQQANERLRDAGAEVYPGVSARSNHGVLAPALLDAREDDLITLLEATRLGMTATQVLAAWREHFSEWLRSTASAQVRLVSGEEFSSLSNVAHHFKSVVPGAEVFMYTRSPVSYAVSTFQQHLKSGASFDEIAAATLTGDSADWGSPAPLSLLPHYRQRLEPYVDAFGADRVHVRSFESAQESLVHDFSSWVFGSDTVQLEEAQVNASLGNGPAYLLEAMNRHVAQEPNHEKRDRLRRQAFLLVRGIDSDDPFVPPPFDWERFGELVAADSAWLAEFTEGKILYDDIQHPGQGAGEDLDWLAGPLVELLGEHAQLNAERQVFRRLFHYADEREHRGPDLSRVLGAATDPQFLETAAHHFRRLGYADDATIAADAAEQLADEP